MMKLFVLHGCAGVAGSRLEPASGTALNWETLTTSAMHQMQGRTGRKLQQAVGAMQVAMGQVA